MSTAAISDMSTWMSSNELATSIVLAFVLAWLGMKKYVRQRAWLAAYGEKRQLVNRFVDSLDEAGHIVSIIGELHETRDEPLGRQILMMHSWADVRWGPEISRPYVNKMLQMLPQPEEVNVNAEEAAERITACRTGILNLLIEDYHKTYREIGMLRTRLIMRLRNPDTPTPAAEHVAEVFGQLVDGTQGRDIDYERFAETWGRRMAPVKIALRRDLTRSILSLRAAIGLSPWWHLSWRSRRIARWFRERRSDGQGKK